MKKFLLSTIMILLMLSLTAFASPISMSLFQDGFSVLDKLFIIGLGITLIGVLFLCIAFCKSVSKKEKPIDSPFDVYLEEDAQEDNLPEEKILDEASESEYENVPDEVLADVSEEISTEINEDEVSDETPSPIENHSEEVPEEPLEEMPEELPKENLEETSEEIPENIPEEVSEELNASATEEVSEELNDSATEEVEEIIYPKLILTHVQTNDFVILPLYPETTVGRKTENDLVLSDVTISGLHCKILNENGLIYVVDENSTNGTFVNDVRISEKTQIHHGDKLTLGKQEFNISVNE